MALFWHQLILNKNIMKSAATLLLFVFILFNLGNAQISFTQDDVVIEDLEVSSGAPMAISDMNGDGLDDIVSLDNTRELYISFQNQDGSFNIVDFTNVGSSNWGMTVGDVDNDGKQEIFTGGAYDNVNLVRFEEDGILNTSFMDGPDIFVQAVSFFDIDNDGALDAVACHDDGPNAVYMNDGSGQLSYSSDGNLFTKFSGQENNSGNYGNVWSDVNGDGLMDYYIAKCRQGVTSMTDGRRINQLWLNNGDGTYMEAADSFGLAIGFQTWTAEFQDIDNDGDMDCFMTNHDARGQLFENVNNEFFVDISAASGINVSGLPIQATMKDFDNDGFVDLLVTGINGALYSNNGDKTFSRIETSVSNFVGGENSFACGDLNHDGFLDLMIGYGNGFNGPSSVNDRLWINNTNDNHWLGVQLEGVASNIGGIGSKIEIYGEWGVMIREVRAGESYGISHTLTQHFGIGDATTIDEIIVRWPSGQVDNYIDISPDQFVRLKEGNCITPPSSLSLDGPTTFCSGDELTMTAESGYQYMWSNGATSQSITVNTTGQYSVEISDGSDCSTTSINIDVVVNPEESFEIFPQSALVICENEFVEITADLGVAVNWNTGEVGTGINVSESGLISATAQGTCEEIMSNTLEVEVVALPAEPSNFDIEYTNFGEVTLSADGEGISWYSDAAGNQFIDSGNEIIVDDIFATTTVYAQSSTEDIGSVINGGEADHAGSSDYNSDEFNGEMRFFAQQPFILRSVTVDTDMAGERTIELRDNYGTVLYDSKTFMLEEGKTTVKLNFEIENQGVYILTTLSETNLSTLGHISPRLKRSSEDFGAILNYPYNIGNLATIVNSNFGEGFFYYFYNWEVSESNDGCVSELVPFEVLPSSTSSIDDAQDISILPNPSQGIFNLRYDQSDLFDVYITAIDGREIMHAKNRSQDYQIDLSRFDAGIYILKMEVAGESFFSKLIKL